MITAKPVGMSRHEGGGWEAEHRRETTQNFLDFGFFLRLSISALT